jgi:hypothetical protein
VFAPSVGSCCCDSMHSIRTALWTDERRPHSSRGGGPSQGRWAIVARVGDNGPKVLSLSASSPAAVVSMAVARSLRRAKPTAPSIVGVLKLAALMMHKDALQNLEPAAMSTLNSALAPSGPKFKAARLGGGRRR